MSYFTQLHRSEPILRCRDGVSPETPCTLIKACHDGVVVPEGLRSTNRAGGEVQRVVLVAHEHSQDETMHTGSTSSQRTGRPRCKLQRQTQLGHRNSSAQWQLFRQQYQHLQYQQQLVASSTTDPWQVLPETADPLGTGGVWTRERIGLVCDRPTQHNVRVQESMNHRQDWCGNARSNDEMKV